MTFFLDNMISHKFAVALRAVGKDVFALKEQVPEDTPDTEWLADVGRRRWIVLTGDRHIRSRSSERAVLDRWRVTVLLLGRFYARKTYWEQFVWLVRRWSVLEAGVASLRPGTSVLVQENGRFRLLPSR